MTKSFKAFLELYEPKSADEKKFVDKHIVAQTPDRNGNGDDVFKGSKVKKVDRKKDRHGHEPKEDESVYEEAEQVDEISADMVNRYREKAFFDKKDRSKGRALAFKKLGAMGKGAVKVPATKAQEEKVVEYKIEQDPDTGEYRDDEGNVWGGKKGQSGYYGNSKKPEPKEPHAVHIKGKKWKTFGSKAHAQNVAKKIPGATVHKEETEVNEVLASSDPMGTWIKDFQKSKNPKFAGKSPEKRRQMAIAAKLAADREEQKEEVDVLSLMDSLNESNKKLMLSVYEKLTAENKQMFIEALQLENGIDAMLDFAIKNRGLE